MSLLRRDLLLAGAAGLAGLSAFPLGWAAAAQKPRRKLLLFTRSAGFQHDVVKRKGDELAFAEKTVTELGKTHGFDVTATKDGGVFDSDLNQFDAFFFYTTGVLTNEKATDGSPPMSEAGKQRLFDAVAAGKGFLGSHCASDTFHKGAATERQLEPDPYIAMLGGEFISHGAQQKSRMVVTSDAFPGLAGVGKEFAMHEEWYSLKNLAEDMHVILVQDTEGMKGWEYQRPRYPATWARKHGDGRVFYTSMGHRDDVWTNATFQQILLGGLSWAFGDVKFDAVPNFKEVTPGGQVIPDPKKKAA